MKRREFVKSAALSAAALGAGNVAKGAVGRAAASATAPEAIKAVLLHLGHNMWCDWFPEGMDLSKFEKGLPDTTLRCKDDLWRKVTDHAAAKGMNMVVIDLGRSVVTQPPWACHHRVMERGKLRARLNQLRGMGLEPIPAELLHHAQWVAEVLSPHAFRPPTQGVRGRAARCRQDL